MEICGEAGRSRENPLAILPLALCKQLLKPLLKAAEVWRVGTEEFHPFPTIIQQFAGCCILERNIIIHLCRKQLFLCSPRPVEQPLYIPTSQCQRQEAYRRKHRESPPHIIRYHKALPSILHCHIMESTTSGIGYSHYLAIIALFTPSSSQCLEQQSE